MDFFDHQDQLKDKYTALQKIGDGSFSEVIKVKEIRTGTSYAAKILKQNYLSPEEAFSCTELKVNKSMDYHPNVVTLVDIVYCTAPGNLILFLELMEMSMYDYILRRTRTMPETRAKHFLYQIISGLKHLNRFGIFHRDLKPENILIKINRGIVNDPAKRITVKISDFGSACFSELPQPHSAYISTRWYRAPECLLTSGYYGSKMDIWALGCVFYEMLTLHPLFPGKSEVDQLAKIHEVMGTPTDKLLSKFRHKHSDLQFTKRKPIPLHKFIPLLSGNGIDVLSKMLAYHPDFRINVDRLLEHTYFDDFRTKRKYDSTPSLRLNIELSSSRQIKEVVGIPPNNKMRSFHSLDRLTKNSNTASESLYSNATTTKRNLDKCSAINARERAWGMNPCKHKDSLLTAMGHKIANN